MQFNPIFKTRLRNLLQEVPPHDPFAILEKLSQTIYYYKRLIWKQFSLAVFSPLQSVLEHEND